jgi:hypothetical protein
MPVTTPNVTPRPVTIAVRVLYASVVLSVISDLLQVAVLHTMRPSGLPLTVLGCLVTVLFAYYVGRGKRVARILVWVIAAGSAIAMADLIIRHVGGPDDGHFAYLITVQALDLAVWVTVAILLGRPAARPYFWHRPPVVTPGSPNPAEDRPAVH